MMEEELLLERVLALLQLERDEEEQARLQERIGTPLAVLVKRGHLLRPVVVVAVRTDCKGHRQRCTHGVGDREPDGQVGRELERRDSDRGRHDGREVQALHEGPALGEQVEHGADRDDGDDDRDRDGRSCR